MVAVKPLLQTQLGILQKVEFSLLCCRVKIPREEKQGIHKPEALIRGTGQLQEPLKVESKLVLV